MQTYENYGMVFRLLLRVNKNIIVRSKFISNPTKDSDTFVTEVIYHITYEAHFSLSTFCYKIKLGKTKAHQTPGAHCA